jgi:septal ring-binding cell division protein DamX
MRMFLVVAGGLLVLGSLPVSTTPALAEFYLVKDTTKNKCKIVDTKPDGQKMAMLGASSYATKQEARIALSHIPIEECPNKPTTFYLGKEPGTNHCKVVHKKPDGKTTLMVGASSYATEDEAKAARSKMTPEECRGPSEDKHS